MVLLIEDHDEVRAWMADMLRLAGHIVATAANGAEALSLLRLVRPSVIISDLDMPVMDGWTFREQQLASPALCDIPFVVVSASPVSAEDAETLRAGAVLAKPLSVARLLECVRRYDHCGGPPAPAA